MSNVHGYLDIESGKSTRGAYSFNPFARPGGSPARNSSGGAGDKNWKACMDVFFPSFRLKSFTFLLCSLQVLLFAITIIHYYSSTKMNWNCILLKYGAKYEPKIRFHYEVHRLIAPIFLHGGYMHIIMNLIGQLMYGFALEEFYGKYKYLAFFLISGICRNSLLLFLVARLSDRQLISRI